MEHIAKKVAAAYIKQAMIQPVWSNPETGECEYQISKNVTLHHNPNRVTFVRGPYADTVSLVPILKDHKFRWDPLKKYWFKPMKRLSDVKKLVENLQKEAEMLKTMEFMVDIPKLPFKIDERDIAILSRKLNAVGKSRWVKGPHGWKLSFLVREPMNQQEMNEIKEIAQDWIDALIEEGKRMEASKAESNSNGPTDKQIQMLMRIPEQDWFDLVDGAVDQSIPALRRISRQFASDLISEYFEDRRRFR